MRVAGALVAFVIWLVGAQTAFAAGDPYNTADRGYAAAPRSAPPSLYIRARDRVRLLPAAGRHEQAIAVLVSGVDVKNVPVWLDQHVYGDLDHDTAC